MTIAALKEYLSMVVQTEKEVNAQEELCRRLSCDVSGYNNQLHTLNYSMRKPIAPSRKSTNEDDRKRTLSAGIFLLGFSIPLFIFILNLAHYVWLHAADGSGVLLVFIFPVLISLAGYICYALWKIAVSLTSRDRTLEKDDTIYKEAVKTYKKQCRQYNGIQAQIQQLTTQIAAAEAYRQQVEISLKSSKRNLEKMYSYNVVFPKYRNYVMVSSIYEYLCSGRCTTLEGHDGAYNILELEIRLDKIITRLDDILKNLEAIRTNQYTLYRCLQDSNQKIGMLVQEETRIAEGMQKLGTQGYEMNQRLGELQRSSELSNYLAECNQQELHYMNRMNYLAGNYDNPYGNYAPV